MIIRTIAIDPGVNGALAMYDAEEREILIKHCPKTYAETRDLLRDWTDDYEGQCRAYLEKVHGRGNYQGKGNAGAQQNFAFGANFGMWNAMLTALYIPYTYVTAKQWQEAIGGNLPKEYTKRKKAVWERMQGQFPSFKICSYAADAVAILSTKVKI